VLTVGPVNTSLLSPTDVTLVAVLTISLGTNTQFKTQQFPVPPSKTTPHANTV
jgi:hypothetical protein